MSKNKLALIRYKVIDECLRNKMKDWTIESLIKKVSDSLYEYEGITDGVSKRTIQLDIQNMRSDKIGYNAPIEVYDRKYYKYSDPNYSITNSPLTKSDNEKLKNAISLLKQFSGFSYYEEIADMVARLEGRLTTESTDKKALIHLEKNELLKGLKYIEPIYKSLTDKTALLIEYKSFKAEKSSQFIFSPMLLKEYRNRWFMLGAKKKVLLTLALDRISNIEILTEELYNPLEEINVEKWYDDVIGVTKTIRQRCSNIVFRIHNSNFPYIETKPLHHSQKLLKDEGDWKIIGINVVYNYELETVLLGFGETLEVLAPRRLRNRIHNKLKCALEKYT